MAGKVSKIFKAITIVWPVVERIYNWWMKRKAKKKRERELMMTNAKIVKLTPPPEGAKKFITVFTAPVDRDLLIKAIDGELRQNTFVTIRKANEVVFESLSKIINRDDNFIKTRILVPRNSSIEITLESPEEMKSGSVLQFAVEELR